MATIDLQGEKRRSFRQMVFYSDSQRRTDASGRAVPWNNERIMIRRITQMKKVISIALAAAMATSLVACGGSAASSTAPAASTGGAASTASGDVDYSALDAVELIAGDSTSKGAAGQIFGELVASKVDEITGGQLTIDYHPNADLGGDADLLRQMQSNDIQMVVCQTAPTVSFIPEAAVLRE